MSLETYSFHFNPDVTSLKIAHQDFFNEMQSCNAGEGYKNFKDFILNNELRGY